MMRRLFERLRRACPGLLTAALAAALVVGCGGGGLASGEGSTGGVGSGGTGTFAMGPISGYGSILVNGVRYDISQLGAAPVDDDGRPRDAASLQLGTVVRVEAGPIDDSVVPPRAVARAVAVTSEVVGPVESALADATGRTLQVAGQTVRIQTGATVLDDRLAAAGPAPGDWVEVYGTVDSAVLPARIVATRVEPHGASGARVRGTVTELGAASLRIGSGLYSFGGGTPPAGVALGRLVQLRLQGSAGHWQVGTVADTPAAPAEAASAHVSGRVTSLVSASRFVIDGLTVDASGVPTAGLAVGKKVEVEGPIRDGVLVATQLQIETEDDSGETVEPYELHGTIAAVDTAGGTFSLSGRSELFRLGAATVYEEGGAANVVAGMRVEMRGTLNADGRSIDVLRIHFER
ncbi:MAG: hypothetical protein KF720_04695 [Rubrivivax sp.]|nr:hypothetical protein [Rubrivivax sp.]